VETAKIVLAKETQRLKTKILHAERIISISALTKKLLLPKIKHMPRQQSSEKDSFPYKTGEGSYNRISGNKTLIFVGIMITLIVALAIASIIMMSRNSSVKVQSGTVEKTIQNAQINNAHP